MFAQQTKQDTEWRWVCTKGTKLDNCDKWFISSLKSSELSFQMASCIVYVVEYSSLSKQFLQRFLSCLSCQVAPFYYFSEERKTDTIFISFGVKWEKK